MVHSNLEPVLLNRWRTQLVILLSSAAVIGCLEPMPTAESVDQKLVGKWTLVNEPTLQEQISVLKSAKILNDHGDIQEFRRNFPSSYFTIELIDTARFTCEMGSALEKGVFSGHWNTEGDAILLIQTHAGDKEKSDRMEGRVVDGELHLKHTTQGINLPYILKRNE